MARCGFSHMCRSCLWGLIFDRFGASGVAAQCWDVGFHGESGPTAGLSVLACNTTLVSLITSCWKWWSCSLPFLVRQLSPPQMFFCGNKSNDQQQPKSPAKQWEGGSSLMGECWIWVLGPPSHCQPHATACTQCVGQGAALITLSQHWAASLPAPALRMLFLWFIRIGSCGDKITISSLCEHQQRGTIQNTFLVEHHATQLENFISRGHKLQYSKCRTKRITAKKNSVG